MPVEMATDLSWTLCSWIVVCCRFSTSLRHGGGPPPWRRRLAHFKILICSMVSLHGWSHEVQLYYYHMVATVMSENGYSTSISSQYLHILAEPPKTLSVPLPHHHRTGISSCFIESHTT